MTNAMNTSTVDWALALGWGLGHAVLSSLVGHTAVNAAVTYDAIRVEARTRPSYRWIGRCKECCKGRRIDGALAIGRTAGRHDETIVVSGTSCYRTACHGTDQTVLFVACSCSASVKLSRVFDDHKPNKPRHECNAKCLASTGPACECKCRGANHGAGH